MPIWRAIEDRTDRRPRAGITRFRTAPTPEATIMVCLALALALAALALRVVARL